MFINFRNFLLIATFAKLSCSDFPLHRACANMNESEIQTLIDLNQQDVNSVDSQDQTPLHHLLHNRLTNKNCDKFCRILSLFREKNANIKIADIYRNTVFDLLTKELDRHNSCLSCLRSKRLTRLQISSLQTIRSSFLVGQISYNSFDF